MNRSKKWTGWIPWGVYTDSKSTKKEEEKKWGDSPNTEQTQETGQPTLKSEMKRQLSNFIGTTTIKGVGKAQKTKSCFLRLLWTLSTIVGLSVCIFIISILTLDYFERDTVTKLENCPNCQPPFPDVTVCALNMIDTLQELDLMSYDEYVQDISYLHQLYSIDNDEEVARYFYYLYSTSAYFANINYTQFFQLYGSFAGQNWIVHDCKW